MVERDPVLCELLNEDVGFFLDPNIMIKFCVSCVLLNLLAFTVAIYLQVEHILC
jgi:hypothetical protein